jgi:hypothetical protein
MVGADKEEPFAAIDDSAGTDSADLLNSLRTERIASFQRWLTQTSCAGIWICEGIFIVFLASIEAGEILLNQERKCPETS